MLFKDEKFGMFVHFGLYSQTKWHEQYQMRKGVAKSEYVKLKDTFNPYNFNAEELVLFLKSAGAQYLCFTAKHHDGFCMWHTKYTDYNIKNTPYKKDILKEISDACHKHNIKFEIYYSCPDWHCKHSINSGGDHQLSCPNPGDEPNEDLYIEYVKNQITELLTNYGTVSALFWDIPPKRRDKSVNELARRLQPGIFINDRGYDTGDYSTPERSECIKNAKFDRLCEACQSVGMQSWGYRENEDYFTPSSIIASMSSVLIKGANFILNVGPDDKGVLPAEAKQIFAEVGKWYKKIKESVIDCEYIKLGEYEFTYKNNTLYLHLPPAFGCSGVVLKGICENAKSVCLLNSGKNLNYALEYTPIDYDGKTNPKHLHIFNIPAQEYMPENMVIKMEFDNLNKILKNQDTSYETIL